MFKKRPLTLAMAALALAGSAVAVSTPAEAAGYTTGGAIGSLYNAQGRTLGVPTSNEYSGYADRVQNFRYGLIYWSAATGAHSVRGGILGEYRNQGSDAGKLGLPITEEKAMVGGGVYQQFKGGIIYWSAATGAHSVRGGILGEYKNQGSNAGKLGLPITGERATVGGGVYQQFKGGIIYWTPGTGAHAVLGAIRSAYAQTGAERYTMGFPTSGEITVKNAGASFVYQTFEHGMISWNGVRIPVFNEDPSHAHVVFGDFYKEYLAAGGVKVVGYISTEQVIGVLGGISGTVVAGGQWFQNGGIVSKTDTGVHYLPNAWLDVITPEVQATLGFPTSGVHAVADGKAMDFENGSITQSSDGTFTVIPKTPPTTQSGTQSGSLLPGLTGRAGLIP